MMKNNDKLSRLNPFERQYIINNRESVISIERF